MQLSVEQHPKGVLIEVSGDIDTLTAPEMQACLTQELREEPMLFIIDLTAVRYISSMGLRVFLSHLKRVKANEGSMVIAGASKLVNEVFRMSGFANYFEMVGERVEALDRLN